MAKLECGEGEHAGFVREANLLGSVIGVQSGDVNTISKEATLTYKALEQFKDAESRAKNTNRW